MEELNTSKTVMQSGTETTMPAWLNQVMQLQAGRIHSLIDILYVMNVTWLYIFSLIYPLFGIIFGIILSSGSISDAGKKIGRICLVLGIINIILSILIVVAFIFIGGIFSKFSPYYL